MAQTRAGGDRRPARRSPARKTMDQEKPSTTEDDGRGGNNAGAGLSALVHPPPSLTPPPPATNIPNAVAPTKSNSDAAGETDGPGNERAPDQPSNNPEASTIVDDKPTHNSSQPRTPRTERSTDTRIATRPGPKPVQTPPKTPKKIIHIRDIETSKTVEKFLMGTAVLCVAALDPIWPGENSPQRSVDPEHVKELASRFATGITRSAPNHRLHVTMSRDLFQRTIKNTVKVLNNQDPKPMLPFTEQALLAQAREMIHDTSDSFERYPVLYLPENYDMNEAPVILQSGQHRVAALLQIFSQTRHYTGYDEKLFTPDTVARLGWVCNIADAGLADASYYAAVRPNRHDQYKEADHGTFFANLKEAGDALSDDMKLEVFANESSWVSWAMATVGLPHSSVSRFYTLIKDEKVSTVIYKWVKHAFGRETFVISQWTSIVSQRMWSYWDQRIKKFWDNFNKMTQHLTEAQRVNISSNDMNLITYAASPSREIKYIDALRMIFFPCPEDYNSRVAGIPIDRGWWALNTAGQYKRYNITPPALGKHSFRRPEFLRALSNREYTEFYRDLSDQESTLSNRVDSPEQLIKQITAVGQPLSQIYRHILFWFRPSFEVPIGAQYARLKAYDVKNEVDRVAFPVPDLDLDMAIAEGKTEDEAKKQHEKARSQAGIKALNLLRCLVRIIENRPDVFDVAANTRTPWMFREQELANIALSLEQREDYLALWAKQPYFSVLQGVLALADRTRLEGCMWALRTPGSELQLRETLPTLETVQTAITKAYQRRFVELQNSSGGGRIVNRVEMAVHKGMEYLIPLLEFSKLQSIYLELRRKREEAKESGLGAASVVSSQEMKGYEGQLDRFIKHLAPFGINVTREVPLEQQQLPPSHVLVTPGAAPTDAPLGLDTRTYQPPPSPRRPKKRTTGRSRSTASPAKPSPKPRPRRRHREPSPSEGEEDGTGDSEGGSPIPPPKRRRLLQSNAKA